MPDRILLIQLRRIGDVLMTTPSLRALRQAYPKAHIVYLTEAPSDRLFAHNPHVDEVWLTRRRAPWRERLALLGRLRRARFDLAIDFFSNPSSALMTWATRAPRRIGFDFRIRRWAYTDPVPASATRQYAPLDKGLLLAPLGVALGSPLPELPLGDAERAYADGLLASLGVTREDLLVALMPVSRQPYKRWPLDRFARVADWLIETHGAKVLFIWGPGEEDVVNRVRADMKQDALPGYPVPDLLELAALLERCTLYVGNDAGPRHFAIAVGTPSVGIFGRPFPENWTPPHDARHRTVSYDPGCKAACTYPRCDHLSCIRGVPYEAAQDATEALIESICHGPVV
jgi:ADP-heptose:LPS heptosyltransferase